MRLAYRAISSNGRDTHRWLKCLCSTEVRLPPLPTTLSADLTAGMSPGSITCLALYDPGPMGHIWGETRQRSVAPQHVAPQHEECVKQMNRPSARRRDACRRPGWGRALGMVRPVRTVYAGWLLRSVCTVGLLYTADGLHAAGTAEVCP